MRVQAACNALSTATPSQLTSIKSLLRHQVALTASSSSVHSILPRLITCIHDDSSIFPMITNYMWSQQSIDWLFTSVTLRRNDALHKYFWCEAFPKMAPRAQHVNEVYETGSVLKGFGD
jgi:hypothetical protein